MNVNNDNLSHANSEHNETESANQNEQVDNPNNQSQVNEPVVEVQEDGNITDTNQTDIQVNVTTGGDANVENN